MVPHVDKLRKSSSRGAQYSLHLEPEGNRPQPATEEDLCFAIKCILEALEQLHSEPDPLLHRDIRWPNIVQKRDNSAEWLLIDWEDASTFPTLPPSRSFSRETHSPRVFEAGHGTEVDLWAVGTLITTWEGGQPSESMMQLAEEMINGAIKTATDALLQFNEYMEPKIVLS
ncbi:hypothetical protein FRC17_002634 [Serendipita sp. 399]|nr:hypothetical protein FRC17_002634 [Serendipita sp. 399]